MRLKKKLIFSLLIFFGFACCVLSGLIFSNTFNPSNSDTPTQSEDTSFTYSLYAYIKTDGAASVAGGSISVTVTKEQGVNSTTILTTTFNSTSGYVFSGRTITLTSSQTCYIRVTANTKSGYTASLSNSSFSFSGGLGYNDSETKSFTVTCNFSTVVNPNKIIFSNNGGTGGPGTLYFKGTTAKLYSDKNCTSAVSSVTCPTKTGSFFMGYLWDGGTGDYIITSNGSVNTSSKVFTQGGSTSGGVTNTATADWFETPTVTLYKVTLDKGSGSGGADAFWFSHENGAYKYYSDSAGSNQITSLTNVPSLSGKVFAGFYDSTAGTTVRVSRAGSFSASMKSDSDHTLYAVYGDELITNQRYFYINVPGSTIKQYYYNYQSPHYYTTIYNGEVFAGETGIASNPFPVYPSRSSYGLSGYCSDYVGYGSSGEIYINSEGLKVANKLCYKPTNYLYDPYWTPYIDSVYIVSSIKYSNGKIINSIVDDEAKLSENNPGTAKFSYYYVANNTFINDSSITYTVDMDIYKNHSLSHHSGKSVSLREVTSNDGYVYKGYSIFSTSTANSDIPTEPQKTTSTFSSTISTSSYVMLYFDAPSKNTLKYDEDEKYFYFEDGYALQSYVGESDTPVSSTDLDNYFTADKLSTLTPKTTMSFYDNYGSQHSIKVYEYTDENYYGAISAVQNMSLMLTGRTSAVNFVYGTKYWFKYEPIRWRVSDYGVEKTWTGWQTGESRTNFDVVSDKIIWATNMTGNVKNYLGAGVGYDDRMKTRIENINSDSNAYNYSTTKDVTCSKFAPLTTDANGNKVGSDELVVNETLNLGVRLASVAEISENFTDKRAKMTDFVAFLLGKDVDYAKYLTRDMGSKYYNLTGISAGGVEKDVWAKNFLGIRLTITFSEGTRVS